MHSSNDWLSGRTLEYHEDNSISQQMSPMYEMLLAICKSSSIQCTKQILATSWGGII